jgi:tetratricopeptide (TPR) repeat protein
VRFPISLVPSFDSEQRLQDGLDALGRADFPAAIEILAQVAAKDPSNADAWRALGICYLEIREPKTALQALERSLQAEPDDADTHYVLGSASGTLGDLERAAACYRRALEINPDHAKAEEFLIRAEALLESRNHFRRGLKLLYAAEPSREDLNQALRDFIQSAAIFEASPARESLADCAQKLLALRREAPADVEINPENAAWSRACERGFQCVLRSNWVGARVAYEEALAYRAFDAFVHHALGFSMVSLGEPGDAVRAWLRVVELEPSYDFSCFGRVGTQP